MANKTVIKLRDHDFYWSDGKMVFSAKFIRQMIEHFIGKVTFGICTERYRPHEHIIIYPKNGTLPIERFEDLLTFERPYDNKHTVARNRRYRARAHALKLIYNNYLKSITDNAEYQIVNRHGN